MIQKTKSLVARWLRMRRGEPAAPIIGERAADDQLSAERLLEICGAFDYEPPTIITDAQTAKILWDHLCAMDQADPRRYRVILTNITA